MHRCRVLIEDEYLQPLLLALDDVVPAVRTSVHAVLARTALADPHAQLLPALRALQRAAATYASASVSGVVPPSLLACAAELGFRHCEAVQARVNGAHTLFFALNSKL